MNGKGERRVFGTQEAHHRAPATNRSSPTAAPHRAAVGFSEHHMSLPIVVAASVALVVAEAVRKAYAHRREAAARRLSGGRKALVANLFAR
jgi:hypothetical protein